MAVLQKIRNRSGLLLLIIGFALLAFVVQDLFTKGLKSQSHEVGSVNGKDIAFEDFRVKVANLEKSGQGGQMTQTQAVNQTWEIEVNKALLVDQFDKAGIRVGEAYKLDAFKKDPNIGSAPMFQTNGKFDLTKFKDFFKNNPDQAKMFEEREKDMVLNGQYQIYNTMVKAGMYTTKAEGKFKYALEQDKVNFDYVGVMYSSVKDSEVKVTDEDITAYMKKHEKRFKAEETREIEFVLVEDKPSTKDQEEVKEKLVALLNSRVEYNKTTGTNDTLPGFKDASNLAEFVGQNSDLPYDTTYVSKQQLPTEAADALFNLPTGEIYGPYINNKHYCLSKMIGRKANDKVKASHILISWEGIDRVQKKEKRTKEEAKAKAESLLAQAKANPSSFMMLALTNSDDSSAQQGGDLGYFGPGQMVKPFNDFAFNNPVGTIGLVESEFGYHIINVTDKQDAVRLATIAHKIQPSESTTNEAYTKATQFEMDAAAKDFAAIAKKANLKVESVRAKAMDEAVGAAGNQRQIVKWAYTDDTNVGDIKRFEVVNVGHVIARLKKINPKGLTNIEDARPSVEGLIKNEKKAQIILAKMKGGSLASIAAANKVTVQNSAAVAIDSPMLPNVGMEPKVVGTAFGTGVNKVSAPIEGISGVYVVQTKSVTKAPKIAKYDDYITKLKQQAIQNTGRVIPTLKNAADIEDNRLEFY